MICYTDQKGRSDFQGSEASIPLLSLHSFRCCVRDRPGSMDEGSGCCTSWSAQRRSDGSVTWRVSHPLLHSKPGLCNGFISKGCPFDGTHCCGHCHSCCFLCTSVSYTVASLPVTLWDDSWGSSRKPD